MFEGLPDPSSTGTVLVGMSGGVDSAVAALLLRDAGYDIQGLFMANWEDDGYCTTARDFQDARCTSEVLGITLHRVNFAAEYRERVFEHFLHEYRANRTPNPDVLCNREIKFGVCLDYMRRLGGNMIATGHYARTRGGGDAVQLLKGADHAKDQSYFLHGVSREALARTLFPLGGMNKAEVRALAHQAGLPVYDKKDSTGICFIGERPFQEFLERYVGTQPGPIEDEHGKRIGEHRGLALYTLGQRSGLGIGGRAGGAAAPWYVADKHVGRNALIVVQDPDHPRLLSEGFEVEAPHWLASDLPEHFTCGVKTRYRQPDLPCTVHCESPQRLHVTLGRAARAVTPGQYAVFYQGDRCLGGGIIATRAHRGYAEPARGISYNVEFSAEGS